MKFVTTFTVHIVPSTGNPPGRLAEAELHFHDGLLAGLKLIGFSIWERRGGVPNARNVTFPARSYTVNGDRRSYAVLRPRKDVASQEGIRVAVLDAYETWEAEFLAAEARRTAENV